MNYYEQKILSQKIGGKYICACKIPSKMCFLGWIFCSYILFKYKQYKEKYLEK